MKEYRIIKEVYSCFAFSDMPHKPKFFDKYHVQVKFLWFWITIKTFVEDDPDFALRQAEELLDKLNEE